jgi:hypothetical protein
MVQRRQSKPKAKEKQAVKPATGKRDRKSRNGEENESNSESESSSDSDTSLNELRVVQSPSGGSSSSRTSASSNGKGKSSSRHSSSGQSGRGTPGSSSSRDTPSSKDSSSGRTGCGTPASGKKCHSGNLSLTYIQGDDDFSALFSTKRGTRSTLKIRESVSSKEMEICFSAASYIADLPAMSPFHQKLRYLAVELKSPSGMVSGDVHVTLFVTFLLHLVAVNVLNSTNIFNTCYLSLSTVGYFERDVCVISKEMLDALFSDTSLQGTIAKIPDNFKSFLKKKAHLYTDAALKLGVTIERNEDLYAKVSLNC